MVQEFTYVSSTISDTLSIDTDGFMSSHHVHLILRIWEDRRTPKLQSIGHVSSAHCSTVARFGASTPDRSDTSAPFIFAYIYIYIQCLDMRIKQHIPTKIRNHTLSLTGRVPNTYGSTICEHLLNNRGCAANFSADWFAVLSRLHLLFHL